MKKTIQNYRGVRPAQLVSVLEGEGVPESPYQIVEYVLLAKTDGTYITHGKIVPLTEEERNWIGKDE